MMFLHRTLATPALGFLLPAAAFALGLAAGASLRPLTAAQTSTAEAILPAQRPASFVPARAATGYPAEVLKILDGNTFEARVQVWPGIDITTKVRLRGIDTPEMQAKCAEERVKAETARTRLTAILAEGTVEISGVGLDKFGGRVDADASTKSTPDVAAALLRAGLARSYAGGRRMGWCL